METQEIDTQPEVITLLDEIQTLTRGQAALAKAINTYFVSAVIKEDKKLGSQEPNAGDVTVMSEMLLNNANAVQKLLDQITPQIL